MKIDIKKLSDEYRVRKLTEEDIEDIFAGIQNPSAPCDPKGLYLQEITY